MKFIYKRIRERIEAQLLKDHRAGRLKDLQYIRLTGPEFTQAAEQYGIRPEVWQGRGAFRVAWHPPISPSYYIRDNGAPECLSVYQFELVHEGSPADTEAYNERGTYFVRSV